MTKWLNQQAAISWRSNSRPAAQRSARLETRPASLFSGCSLRIAEQGACGWENHLKVLKDAGIITFRREGTKNYYYLDSASSSLLAVSELLQDAVRQMKHCPTYQENEGEHK